MNLAIAAREMPRWLFRGGVSGLILLGIGGRLLMRLIAHMEHRPQFVLTARGTLTVIFAGTVVGLVGGFLYAVVRMMVAERLVRTLVFAAVFELIVWRGVSELLLVPKLMFLGLGIVFIAVLVTLGRRASSASA